MSEFAIATMDTDATSPPDATSSPTIADVLPPPPAALLPGDSIATTDTDATSPPIIDSVPPPLSRHSFLAILSRPRQ